MRPILLLLVAKDSGEPTDASFLSAVTLEMIHSASLIHDDVVDDSDERRGKASVNATYGNQVAVLAGDYLLSNALIKACETCSIPIVTRIADLGRQLAKGEIVQMKNASVNALSEEGYFNAIQLKTAALFSTCAELGALSVGASQERMAWAKSLGEHIGICFQIRDDIFDYYNDNVGKPTGNDLREGKITLPLVNALNRFPDAYMLSLAEKARSLTITEKEIAELVAFAKDKGGIDYARKVMYDRAETARQMLAEVRHEPIREALNRYIDFVVERTS